MSDELNFDDLEPVVLPFTYQKRKYFLREASEGAAVQWRNAITSAAKMEDGKIVGFNRLAESEPLLVSLCTYFADKDGKFPLIPGSEPDPRSLVGLAKVLSWPPKMVKTLFEKAKEISGLNEVKEDHLKNGQSGTGDISLSVPDLANSSTS